LKKLERAKNSDKRDIKKKDGEKKRTVQGGNLGKKKKGTANWLEKAFSIPQAPSKTQKGERRAEKGGQNTGKQVGEKVGTSGWVKKGCA